MRALLDDDDEHFLALGLRLGYLLLLDLELDRHLAHLRRRVAELRQTVPKLVRLVAHRGALLLEKLAVALDELQVVGRGHVVGAPEPRLGIGLG